MMKQMLVHVTHDGGGYKEVIELMNDGWVVSQLSSVLGGVLLEKEFVDSGKLNLKKDKLFAADLCISRIETGLTSKSISDSKLFEIISDYRTLVKTLDGGVKV